MAVYEIDPGVIIVWNNNCCQPGHLQEKIYQIKKTLRNNGGFFYSFYWVILIPFVARSNMAGIVLPPIRLIL